MREYQGGESEYPGSANVLDKAWNFPGWKPPPLTGAKGWGALLYFHHQGQDHWTTMRLFVKELAKRMLDLVFDK